MTIAKKLGEIVRIAPTFYAGVSALNCLRDLARNLDYEAIQELAFALNNYLQFKTEVEAYFSPETLSEFLISENIPGLIRLYAAGFCPRDLVLDSKIRSQLLKVDLGLSQFVIFQDLLRQHSLIEHEILKAYILALYVLTSSYPSVFTCERIMNGCEVVEGLDASSELKFGRELLLEMGVGSFVGIVFHELGHINQEYPGWHGYNRERLTKKKHFLEIIQMLSGLKQSAIDLTNQALLEKDARETTTKAGLRIHYTIHSLNEGFFNHISLSDRGGPLEFDDAVSLLYLMLCALDVESQNVAIAYSPKGLAHLGFLIAADNYNEFKLRKIKKLTMFLLDRIVQDSTVWFGQLAEVNRITHREEYLLRLLNQNYNIPLLYGQVTDLVTLDIEICNALRSELNLNDMTRDALDAVLCSAVRRGDEQIVKTMLASGASLNAVVETGDAEIIYAGSSLLVVEVDGVKSYLGPTISDIFAVIEVLLSGGLDINSVINDDGDTFLLDAVRRNPEVVRFLLTHGADVDGANSRGESALHIAAKANHVDVVRELMQFGADIDKLDRKGNTPLLSALQEGADYVAQLLIISGADPTKTTASGETALMYSATTTTAQALCDAGADINAVSVTGETALMRTSAFGLSKVVKKLLDLGADVNAVTDLGETALHHAIWNPHKPTRLEVVSILISFGADVNIETNNATTALMLAVESYVKQLHGGWDDWTPLSCYDSLDSRLENTYTSFRKHAKRSCKTFSKQAVASDDSTALSLEQECETLYPISWYDTARARILYPLKKQQKLYGELKRDELSELMLLYEDIFWFGDIWLKEDIDLFLFNLSCDRGIVKLLLDAGAEVTISNMSGESPLSLVTNLDSDDDVRRLIEDALSQ